MDSRSVSLSKLEPDSPTGRLPGFPEVGARGKGNHPIPLLLNITWAVLPRSICGACRMYFEDPGQPAFKIGS